MEGEVRPVALCGATEREGGGLFIEYVYSVTSRLGHATRVIGEQVERHKGAKRVHTIVRKARQQMQARGLLDKLGLECWAAPQGKEGQEMREEEDERMFTYDANHKEYRVAEAAEVLRRTRSERKEGGRIESWRGGGAWGMMKDEKELEDILWEAGMSLRKEQGGSGASLQEILKGY